MGYIKHHTIIVTGWSAVGIPEAHKKAKEIFKEHDLVSEIVSGLANGQSSFFIAPDGSKLGWGVSETAFTLRRDFIEFLDNYKGLDIEYVEVLFGGDDDVEAIVNTSNKI
jgi:hypothetical protein